MTEPITDKPLKRKLAVILASDVAGYSALVARNEEQTVRHLAEATRLVRTLVEQQDGRIFNTAGDAILAEFSSAVNAVRCASDIQEALAGLNKESAGDDHLLLRIGIAIGDVIVADNGDLLGDGVNIAARLQTLADPGGLCISRDVQQLVQNKIALGFEDIGEQALKNLPQPVHAYRVRPQHAAALLQPGTTASPPAIRSHARLAMAAAVGLIVAAAGGYLIVARKSAAVQVPAGAEFVAAEVPLVSDALRQRLVDSYARVSGNKALAISNDGDFHGIAANAPDEATAVNRARTTCEKDSTAAHKRPCFIYATGQRVVTDVGDFPMPDALDVVRKPLADAFGRNDTPLARMQQGRRLLKEYPEEKRPKALAIGTRGDSVWGAMSSGASDDEAIRRSLEFCGFRTRAPCVLYAVGDHLVTRPPESQRITGVFTIMTDKAIPDAERKRIAEAYAQRGDWQALAHGANGSWHVEAGATSEAAAVAAALAACGRSDRDCQIYAIGRFKVAPPGK